MRPISSSARSLPKIESQRFYNRWKFFHNKKPSQNNDTNQIHNPKHNGFFPPLFSKKNLLLFLFFCVLLLVFFSIFVLIGEKFRVTHIVVESIPNMQLNGLSSADRAFLPLLSERSLELRIVRQNPMVQSVKVTKRFPDTLDVSVTLYTPVAFVQTDNGYFKLAEDGRIIGFTQTRDSSLPLLIYYQKLSKNSFDVGDRIGYQDIDAALFFARSLTNLDEKPDSVDIGGFDMIVCNIGRKQIVFTSEKSVHDQEYALEELIRQFKIEGKGYQKIDLRFDKPVVTF